MLSRYEPEPEEAVVITEIFELFVGGDTPKAIAEHLNRPGGPPSPNHVDSAQAIQESLTAVRSQPPI